MGDNSANGNKKGRKSSGLFSLLTISTRLRVAAAYFFFGFDPR